MNVTARGMIWGRSCAPLAFQAAAPSSTRRNTPDLVLAWKVENVSGHVGRVATAGENVEVVGEGLPLAPRHPVRERAARDVLDALHHVDQGRVVGWADRGEAHPAIAEHDRGDAIRGRRLQRLVPG